MIERPLSPHLQIYRLPLTAVFSFTHRVTGVVLVAGFLVLTSVLLALAGGPQTYELVHAPLRSLGGRILLWMWLFALFFHLCHGVRHLIWDTGHGFARERLDRHARLELVMAVLLTGFAFFLI